MKAIFFLVSFFGFMVHMITCVGQEYKSMNFKSGYWVERYMEKGGYEEKSQLYCSGDTIVNNDLYYKLCKDKVSYYPNGSIDTLKNIHLGLIKNTKNKKVIFIPINELEPITIYSFGFEIGDTIFGPIDDFIINHIDSVLVCGNFHKRYIQSLAPELHSETLTEGIGFSNGLLGYFGSFDLSGETKNVLQCYSEWNNQSCQPCDFITSNSLKEIKYEVYPNPCFDHLIISTTNPFEEIIIYNLSGVEVYREKNCNVLYKNFDIGELNPGYYILKIRFFKSLSNSIPLIKTSML